MASGRKAWIEFDQQKTDRYDRLLGYVFLLPDGKFLNEAIIEGGYGHAYVQYPFRQDYMDRFRAAEARARRNGIGLWNPALVANSVSATDVPAASSQPALSTIIPVKVLQKKANESETVYITRAGRKYHRGGCRSLSRSQIPITLNEAKQQGYGPCAICRPPL